MRGMPSRNQSSSIPTPFCYLPCVKPRPEALAAEFRATRPTAAVDEIALPGDRRCGRRRRTQTRRRGNKGSTGTYQFAQAGYAWRRSPKPPEQDQVTERIADTIKGVAGNIGSGQASAAAPKKRKHLGMDMQSTRRCSKNSTRCFAVFSPFCGSIRMATEQSATT